jgi:hypothetical protein
MSSIEAQSSDPFGQKLFAVSRALYSVLAGEYPASKQRAIYDYHPDLDLQEKTLLDQEHAFIHTVLSDPDFDTLSTIRRRTKGYTFAFYLAFTDQNSVPLPKEIILKEQTRELVRRLFATTKLTRETVDLSMQYTLAKKVLEEMPVSDEPMDLFDVMHLLHNTFRRMARGFDESVSGNVSISTIRESKKVPTPIDETSNDPAGDVYHFWGAVGLTLISNMRFKPYDLVFNQVYRLAPRAASWITKNIVYRFGTNEGDVHPAVDRSGADVGQYLARVSHVRQ